MLILVFNIEEYVTTCGVWLYSIFYSLIICHGCGKNKSAYYKFWRIILYLIDIIIYTELYCDIVGSKYYVVRQK